MCVDVCLEHIWVLTGLVLDTDGTHKELVCTRCGAATFEGPDQVAGREPV